MCRRIIYILLLSVQLSAGDDKQCKNGAKCMIVPECSGIYSSLKLFDRRILFELLQRLQCGFDENNDSKICCPPSFKVPQESSTSSEQLIKNEALDLLPNKTVCGLQINDKIVGGQNTSLDEHPWMAIVYGVSRTKTKFVCGGVLISSRYVMTAAHCVKSPSTRVSSVRLGEWRLSTNRDCVDSECSPDPINVEVEEIVAHEDNGPRDQHNDIALLRLAENVPFNDFVKPICLPLDTKFKKKTFEAYDLEVAGWGVTEEDILSDYKLKVRVPVTNLPLCRLVYRNYNITDKQICAGGLRGQDSCNGDSGGPLMGQIDSEQNWMAIGIVSYGSLFCGRVGWPAVYTRVTSYTDWILSKIRS